MSGVDISRPQIETLAACCEFRANEAHRSMMEEARERQMATTLLALRAALDAAERAQDDFQASFNLRWKADIRAIKRWQEKHPKRDKVWPAHADLVVWLLEGWEECSVELLKCIHERDAADATGYARGVRDAAGVCERRLISRSYGSHADAYEYAMNAILALLPATEKEKNDDQ